MADSKFNLSKGEDKKSSKFNLTKDETVSTPNKGGDLHPTKSKWWLWLLLLAMAVVAVIVIVLVRNGLSKNGEATIPTDDPTVEQPVTETQPVDETLDTEPSVTEDATISEDTSTNVSGNLDEKAKQVIRGDFGNGAERKQTLGNEYDAIQQRVNEIYREKAGW